MQESITPPSQGHQVHGRRRRRLILEIPPTQSARRQPRMACSVKLFWRRFGGAASLYADGHMYTGTGTGARSFVSGGLDRDATGALVLAAVPEPGSVILLVVGAALVAFRKRK